MDVIQERVDIFGPLLDRLIVVRGLLYESTVLCVSKWYKRSAHLCAVLTQ